MLSNVNNISITGHNNPTINCSSNGGVKFTSCHNCTIEGITWDGCGAEYINGSIDPVIEFQNSTNITIHNCTFQHSVGQAIVLSEVSGSVKFNHCKFLCNKHYKGHGTGIYFSTSKSFQNHSQLLFVISDCNFSENKLFNSIVYFGQYNSESQLLVLNNSAFTSNQGTTLYLSNQNLKITGNVSFDSNRTENGPGIFICNHSTVTFGENSVVTFNHNTANNSGGAIFVSHFSSVIFEDDYVVTFNNNVAINYYGGSIFSYNNCKVVVKSNSSLLFIKNGAKFGGALCIETNSIFTVEENSSATFHNNVAELGGAVYCTNNSIVLFKGVCHHCNVSNLYNIDAYITLFSQESMITVFDNNIAMEGGAIYARYESTVRFKEVSLVTFIYNKAKDNGGAISSCDSSTTLFEGEIQVVFAYNKAELGGAVYVEDNEAIVFRGNSFINFNNNIAEQAGGALFCATSNGTFQDNCNLTFTDNTAKRDGGAAHFGRDSSVTISEYSTCKITFHNNKATQSGAVYSDSNTNITLGGESKIIFANNDATFGGAVYCYNYTTITTKGNSLIAFTNNSALENGGALAMKLNSDIKIKNNSTVMFNNNKAVHNGGSLFSEINSCISFEEDCTVTFAGNTADDGTGGAICFSYNSSLTFSKTKNAIVTFKHNVAAFGGALNLYSHSFTRFQGNANSTVTFENNKAVQNDGAINFQKNSYVIFQGILTVKFHNNTATLGGAIYSNSNSDITLRENTNIIFSLNNAKLGGAIFTVTSNITITGKAKLQFTYNAALQDGGAMFLDKQYKVFLTGDAAITFSFNTASDYGGAIYSRVDQSVINFNITEIHFNNNHAKTAGSSVFINLPTLCNSSCLNNSILGVSKGNNELSKHITTSPRKLELYNPAECTDISDTGCHSYFVENIMLGQEILIDACMYDYYDRPTGTEEFLVSSDDGQDYYIPGSQYILISCNHTFQGISIIENKTTPILPFNYSMMIALYAVRISEMKTISINLIVELSQCHPGFWYHNTSHKCECYNSTNIVTCSGSSSSIKKGYWFGSVTGKPTVTFCPINYCNFTCCETTNGYYHLSPVRDNQCMPHRSGNACGDCEVGYTLSFDSAICIDVKLCTTGQTLLLVTLIMIYWIVIITVVFIMTYFKAEIGYLYGITYYYSIVDILVTQNWFLSDQQLYTLVNVVSSVTKVTPKFLGHFCLVQGMSGIDQQLIHYIHPLTFSFILVIISCLAKRSRRLAYFISRGIICFICYLLLLSYTSVATTSLLLMQPLKFLSADKTYTYLSPEVEYFHGRHFIYGIVAVLFTIVIVIGLPFLLLFEPILNRKINFIKIKPLLDQFQGCYRDKYRCFAAYYMICQLVIIVIVIVSSPNDFTTHYLIITACVIMALVHQFSKPYAYNSLNLFDGAILHQTILLSVLPLVEFFDSFNSTLVTGTMYVLVLLPLGSLIAIKILIHRGNIKNLIVYYSISKWKNSNNSDQIPLNDYETQLLKEVIIDDNIRRNAIIVDV